MLITIHESSPDGAISSYNYGMAIMTIRSTYAFDPETVRTLEDLARRWGVSKSEALRRSVRASAATQPRANGALQALDELQSSLGLSRTAARRWAERVHEERRASSQQRLSRR